MRLPGLLDLDGDGALEAVLPLPAGRRPLRAVLPADRRLRGARPWEAVRLPADNRPEVAPGWRAER